MSNILDEAAKRRELRKQRILGNSENRLRRILNKDDQINSADSNLVNGDSKPQLPLSLKDSDGSDSLVTKKVADVFSDSSSPSIPDLATHFDSSSAFPDLTSMGFLDSDQLGDPLSSQPLLDMADLDQLRSTVNPIELLCRMATSLDRAKTETSPPPAPYRGPAFLIHSTNTTRIRLILLLGVVSRLVLPALPTAFAKLYGPLYLLEAFLFSLCILYKAPFQHSPVSTLFSVLTLFGFHSKLLELTQMIFSCLELILRDMWTYSFSFFVTHALCHHLNVFEA